MYVDRVYIADQCHTGLHMCACQGLQQYSCTSV